MGFSEWFFGPRVPKSEAQVERYRKDTRILHWVVVVTMALLGITGLFLYVPGLGFLAVDSWSRLVHRIAAAGLILGILVYAARNWRASLKWLNEVLTWGWEDWAWFSAAPRYYFMGDESAMPPQGHMNTGQKLWALLLVLFIPLLLLTGILLWFFKNIFPSAVFQWSVFAHDVFFIAVGTFFLVHLYLSVLHPLMRGIFWSMVGGKVSAKYAKAHHGKWYQEVVEGHENEQSPAEGTTGVGDK